jgi:hypothetical protein
MPAKKSASEKKVAVIFSFSPKTRDKLNKKVPSGSRSQFIEKLLEREFSKKTQTEILIRKKGIFSRLFKK